MDKKFPTIVAVIITLTNAIVYLTSATASPRGDCSVSISTPTKGGVVKIAETASGSATLPESDHLWLLAKPRAESRWWLQGEAVVIDGTWSRQVQFGFPQQTGEEFYLAAIAVTANVHAQLTNRQRSVAFPEVAAGCPLDIITATRY